MLSLVRARLCEPSPAAVAPDKTSSITSLATSPSLWPGAALSAPRRQQETLNCLFGRAWGLLGPPPPCPRAWLRAGTDPCGAWLRAFIWLREIKFEEKAGTDPRDAGPATLPSQKQRRPPGPTLRRFSASSARLEPCQYTGDFLPGQSLPLVCLSIPKVSARLSPAFPAVPSSCPCGAVSRGCSPPARSGCAQDAPSWTPAAPASCLDRWEPLAPRKPLCHPAAVRGPVTRGARGTGVPPCSLGGELRAKKSLVYRGRRHPGTARGGPPLGNGRCDSADQRVKWRGRLGGICRDRTKRCVCF